MERRRKMSLEFVKFAPRIFEANSKHGAILLWNRYMIKHGVSKGQRVLNMVGRHSSMMKSRVVKIWHLYWHTYMYPFYC